MEVIGLVSKRAHLHHNLLILMLLAMHIYLASVIISSLKKRYSLESAITNANKLN